MKKILKFLNIFCFSIFVIFPLVSSAYEQNPTLWVQVPQWENDWSECAVDIPDASGISTAHSDQLFSIC